MNDPFAPRPVRVAERIRSALLDLEPALREELARHVTQIAESPGEYLRRAVSPPSLRGLYVSAYPSAVVHNLTITLYFDGFDRDDRALVLVAITRTVGDETDPD